MALLWWIDAARNNLLTATYSYADIQKQLDRYNKVFETYANASPETQMRAASVMRQALDEYNWLKKQQEENTIRIYEAQQWVNYYNNKSTQPIQPLNQTTNQQKASVVNPIPESAWIGQYEEVPVMTTNTPWKLNNNAPVTNMELNALDTNMTMNVPESQSNYIKTNITMPTTTNTNGVVKPSTTVAGNTVTRTPVYWPGSVATMPGTWNVPKLSIPSRNNTKLLDTINDYTRRWIRYVYNYLNRNR